MFINKNEKVTATDSANERQDKKKTIKNWGNSSLLLNPIILSFLDRNNSLKCNGQKNQNNNKITFRGA